MSEEKIKKLKKKYGYLKGSYKYIPAGGEILKFIGQIVVMVDFKRTGEGDDAKWENDYQKVKIVSIENFDPLTMTYDCKYEKEGEKEGEIIEETVKIIPEGFSWGNPEETGEMKRFIPYSIHCQIVEDEIFYGRVKELYESRETMTIEQLTTITESKEPGAILKYAHNIGVAVKLEDGDYLWIRLHELSLRHRAGDNYALRFANDDRHWSMMIKSGDKDYDFEGDGRFKILDLANE